MEFWELKALFFPPVALLLLALSGCAGLQGGTDFDSNSSTYHAHADFKLILDGQSFDFNKSEYMSTPYRELSEKAHMHDYNPNVLHFHNKDATLEDFFSSIGMLASKECIDTNTTAYCAGNGKELAVYVNGGKNSAMFDYRPKDLDKILVYYGTGGPGGGDFNSLTNEACIYSKKCPVPEGFVLPQESCSGAEPCRLDKAP